MLRACPVPSTVLSIPRPHSLHSSSTAEERSAFERQTRCVTICLTILFNCTRQSQRSRIFYFPFLQGIVERILSSMRQDPVLSFSAGQVNLPFIQPSLPPTPPLGYVITTPAKGCPFGQWPGPGNHKTQTQCLEDDCVGKSHL